MTSSGVYQWRDLVPRTPVENVPVQGVIVKSPDSDGFAPSALGYGGGTRLQNGVWVYSVDVFNARTGHTVRVDGVREVVPKFYGDGAGRRSLGDIVLVQSRVVLFGKLWENKWIQKSGHLMRSREGLLY